MAITNVTPPDLKENETYIGVIINPDGTGHHIILLDGEIADSDWPSAMKWAKEQGGDLPSRAEMILLYENHAEKFKKQWYWSNTQNASYPAYAWLQHFTSGYQSYDDTNNYNRARAVRRLEI